MDMSQTSWLPDADDVWGLDRSKPLRPQIVSTVAALALLIGGPLLAVVWLDHVPPLVSDSTMTIGVLAGTAMGLAATFAIWRERRTGAAFAVELFCRAGLGFGIAALVAGLLGIANGYATPVETYDAPVVGKHYDAGCYRVAMRAWPGSQSVVELPTSYRVYAGLNVPVIARGLAQGTLDDLPDADRVQLKIGEGRLGLVWLGGIGWP